MINLTQNSQNFQEKAAKETDKKKDKKKKKKVPKKKESKKSTGKDSSSDFSSDSASDSDVQKDKIPAKDGKKSNSTHSSRSPSPNPIGGAGPSFAADNFKRKSTASPDLFQAKKQKLENFNQAPTAYIPGSRYVLNVFLKNTMKVK